jgi:hypothetical protein
MLEQTADHVVVPSDRVMLKRRDAGHCENGWFVVAQSAVLASTGVRRSYWNEPGMEITDIDDDSIEEVVSQARRDSSTKHKKWCDGRLE